MGILCLIYIWCASYCSSSPVASYGDPLDSELVVSVNGDDLKQQEEESRRRIELEEEERKLEETLEYQRQIEKEAKQKQLAEQSKKSTQTHPDKMAEKVQDVNLEPCANDQDMHEPLKPYVQVSVFTLCPTCLCLPLHSIIGIICMRGIPSC